eukprot:11901355-Alexandrium_andersonii.AAC.1
MVNSGPGLRCPLAAPSLGPTATGWAYTSSTASKANETERGTQRERHMLSGCCSAPWKQQAAEPRTDRDQASA